MAGSPDAEVDVDEALVRRLLRGQAPDMADLPLGLAEEGWDCTVRRLGDEFAVRMPRRAAAAEGVALEQRWLAAVAARVDGVGVPAPVVAGVPGEGFPWPWSVVPWFDGVSGLAVPRADRGRWALPLARALRDLHRPAEAGWPPNPYRGVPLAVRDETVRARIGSLGDDGRGLAAIWAEGIHAPVWDGAPVWVHGDLHPGNLIARGGDLVAIIDWIDLTAGDPAYDLAVAWLAFDAAGRDAFAGAATGYDAGTWTRARAWAAAVAALLLPSGDDHPGYAGLARETVIELTR